MNFEGIATFVKENRVKQDLSQTELAAALGYTNGQFISNVERGLCGVPLGKAGALCKALKVKPSQLQDVLVNDYTAHVSESLNASAQL